MFAVIGRVQIKPGQEELTRQMIADNGVALIRGMQGAKHAYWSRSLAASSELIQHSFWLFDTEEHARAAEQTFNSLRDMPEAPAIYVSGDVCGVIGEVS
ncbi:MAG TPA: antibiotic biosynthesis monooxygenase [Acidimicrobiales bacterium]|nr:antibiotic biosynthesis monooxygenase [Acidimicrobiales bacterium]